MRHSRSAFHGQAAYRFGHLLVRDVAYARIPKRRRAELHELFVAWVDTSDEAGEPEIGDVVGYHLEQAYRLRTELGPADEAARELATRAGRALAEGGLGARRRMDAPAAVNLLSRAAELYAGRSSPRGWSCCRSWRWPTSTSASSTARGRCSTRRWRARSSWPTAGTSSGR